MDTALLDGAAGLIQCNYALNAQYTVRLSYLPLRTIAMETCKCAHLPIENKEMNARLHFVLHTHVQTEETVVLN